MDHISSVRLSFYLRNRFNTQMESIVAFAGLDDKECLKKAFLDLSQVYLRAVSAFFDLSEIEHEERDEMLMSAVSDVLFMGALLYRRLGEEQIVVKFEDHALSCEIDIFCEIASFRVDSTYKSKEEVWNLDTFRRLLIN